MKVMHLSSERTWRGGEQQIAYLLEGLAKEGVDCYVACKKNSAFEEYCIKNSIQHIALSFSNELDVFTAWSIRNFCKQFGVDIIHTHSGHSHAIGVWSSILGNPARLVVSRRVDFPIGKNWFSRFKYNYRRIERIICVSDAIKEIVKKDVKEGQKCITIHSGIDPDRFKGSKNHGKLRNEFHIPPHIRLVANISAIAPHKDYYTFVDAAACVLSQKKDVVFLIIGDGPEKEKIKKYVEEKGLVDQIIFTGFRTDVTEIIQEIDVFLITSRTEGLGTTILDAMVSKIPVVGTSGGGIPEIVIHEKTGLLAGIGESKLLAEHIITLLENTKIREALISNALSFVMDHFTIQRVVSKTLECYKEVASPT